MSVGSVTSVFSTLSVYTGKRMAMAVYWGLSKIICTISINREEDGNDCVLKDGIAWEGGGKIMSGLWKEEQAEFQ